MLKTIADMDVRSSGLQREGDKGKDVGVPVMASRKEEAQPTGSSQLASTPSSTDALLGVGIQVRRTQYFLLLEIDGLFVAMVWSKGAFKRQPRIDIAEQNALLP